MQLRCGTSSMLALTIHSSITTVLSLYPSPAQIHSQMPITKLSSN